MDRSLNRSETVDRTRAAEPTVETDTADSVGWRDISERTDRLDSVDTPDGRVDGRVQGEPVGNRIQDGRIEDRIRARAGEPLTIETGAVRATLVDVLQVRVDDLVYAHHRRRLGDPIRACALFDVENTANVPIRWTSRRTKFIGSDSYTYNRARVSLDPSRLGPGCYPSQVDIEPGCRARVITPVEQLPGGVDVAKVVHTVTFRGRLGNQRLTYTL